jgi:hypothetical protein
MESVMVTSSLVMALLGSVVFAWPVLKLFLDVVGVLTLLLLLLGLVRIVAWIVKRPLG